MVAELRKCSRCHSTIDISYFGVNKKKEPYKTCDNCRKNKVVKQVLPTNSESNLRQKLINIKEKVQLYLDSLED